MIQCYFLLLLRDIILSFWNLQRILWEYFLKGNLDLEKFS